MKVDLVLKNGVVVFPDTCLKADVAVKGEKIAAIGKAGQFSDAEQIIDVEGKYILPGVIDIHCHFRDPGMTHKEDFSTGTYAAAMGGVTTIFDMPNTIPPVASAEAFHGKMEAIKNQAYVDFCLWGTVAGNDFSHIGKLADLGVVAFKIFVGQTTGDLPSPDEGGLLEVLKLIKETGLRAGIHAEDRGFVDYFTRKFREEGRQDYQAVEAARASTAEALAMARLLVLSHRAGNKVHLVHLSTSEGVELVRIARSKGIDVSAETCPQYLILKNSDYARLGQIMKVYPPIRTGRDSETLWAAIKEGVIEIIASDHAPHTEEEKFGTANIWEVPAGMNGVETGVSLMLDQINQGRLTLNDYARITSENPARLFNIYPRKGSIQIGSDADFTIVDMDKEYAIKSASLHSKYKFTPFEGYRVKGCPVYTIVRGNIVMAEGRLIQGPAGVFIKP